MAGQSVGNGAVFLSSMRRNEDGPAQMLESLAQLHVRGATINWAAFESRTRHRRIELPLYPFEHQRYWLEAREETPAASVGETVREAAAWQASQGRLDLSVERYERGWPLLHRLTDAYIVSTLATLGAFQSAGEPHTTESVLE